MTWLLLIVLAFLQNAAFSMVSRARNRDNMLYHTGASVLSNGIWFACMGILVVADMSFTLFIPYLIGTVLGSLFGAKLSIKIEALLGAKT